MWVAMLRKLSYKDEIKIYGKRLVGGRINLLLLLKLDAKNRIVNRKQISTAILESAETI